MGIGKHLWLDRLHEDLLGPGGLQRGAVERVDIDFRRALFKGTIERLAGYGLKPGQEGVIGGRETGVWKRS